MAINESLYPYGYLYYPVGRFWNSLSQAGREEVIFSMIKKACESVDNPGYFQKINFPIGVEYKLVTSDISNPFAFVVGGSYKFPFSIARLSNDMVAGGFCLISDINLDMLQERDFSRFNYSFFVKNLDLKLTFLKK